jgi:hypothetical protein
MDEGQQVHTGVIIPHQRKNLKITRFLLINYQREDLEPPVISSISIVIFHYSKVLELHCLSEFEELWFR